MYRQQRIRIRHYSSLAQSPDSWSESIRINTKQCIQGVFGAVPPPNLPSFSIFTFLNLGQVELGSDSRLLEDKIVNFLKNNCYLKFATKTLQFDFYILHFKIKAANFQNRQQSLHIFKCLQQNATVSMFYSFIDFFGKSIPSHCLVMDVTFLSSR